MADEAHKWTDEQIEKLQKDIGKVYRQASREMRVKLAKGMKEFDKENKEWKRRVKDNPKLNKPYKRWLEEKAGEKQWTRRMIGSLVQDAVRADHKASDIIYDAVPYVFAENADRAAFAIQEGIGKKVDQFALVDEDTVRKLVSEDYDLVPKFDETRDIDWNSKKLNSAVTQSILQGESIPDAARRLQRVVGMDEKAATRVARTAITGAENAGRVHSYERARSLGIELEQQWIATLDADTRIQHRLLDGEHTPVGTKFHVPGYGERYDIQYPGDASALPEMVWNCRCTLIAWFPDSGPAYEGRWSDLPDGASYDDWKDGLI